MYRPSDWRDVVLSEAHGCKSVLSVLGIAAVADGAGADDDDEHHHL
jgi:hypothetical protein